MTYLCALSLGEELLLLVQLALEVLLVRELTGAADLAHLIKTLYIISKIIYI